MKKLTLRPIWKLITTGRGAYITSGAFRELKNQLRRQITTRAARAQNSSREKLYLDILTAKDYFAGRAKISPAELIDEIDTILVEKNYGYRRCPKSASHPSNSFYMNSSPIARGIQLHDLAFFNAAAQKHRQGHHKLDGQYSIFYMRCEANQERILFGNMQVDDRGKEDWTNKALGDELRRSKNIYGMMIQQAVKHALENGFRKIMFQAGDACELAQWKVKNFMNQKVTEKNYAQINECYEREISYFTAAPGTIIERPEMQNKPEFIIKSSPNSYVTQNLHENPHSILSEIYNSTENPLAVMRDNQAWIQQLKCEKEIRARRPRRAHIEFKKLIKELIGMIPPGPDTAAQIADWEERAPATTLRHQTAEKIIESYLERWGYDKILLEHFSEHPTN